MLKFERIGEVGQSESIVLPDGQDLVAYRPLNMNPANDILGVVLAQKKTTEGITFSTLIYNWRLKRCTDIRDFDTNNGQKDLDDFKTRQLLAFL